jgi:hypothetical protein
VCLCNADNKSPYSITTGGFLTHTIRSVVIISEGVGWGHVACMGEMTNENRILALQCAVSRQAGSRLRGVRAPRTLALATSQAMRSVAVPVCGCRILCKSIRHKKKACESFHRPYTVAFITVLVDFCYSPSTVNLMAFIAVLKKKVSEAVGW